MAEQQRKDRILVIDRDPDERSLLTEATLEPYGYEIVSAEDGGTALQLLLDKHPDVVILDLRIQGFSGQDLLAALNAQSIDAPVIVLADRGQESEALNAFRLGAKDYVTRPFREAEIIQVVDRAMREVRLRREREALVGEVRQAADETERHLRELKTLMSIGKTVAGLRRPDDVFERVLRASIQLTQAESAGIFLRDPDSNTIVVRAGHNLNRELIERMGEPVQDALAALVMNSRETYIGSGAGLDKFRPAQQGVTAVIYAPLVVQDAAIGVLWVGNTRLSFQPYLKDIMTAIADYAAIAVANARLFATMEKRAQEQQQEIMALQARQSTAPAPTPATEQAGEQQDGGTSVEEMARTLRRPLTELLGNMNLFRTGEMGPLQASHQAAVDVMHRQLDQLIHRIDELCPPDAE